MANNGTVQDQLERELKFDVPEGWVLPGVPPALVPDGASVEVETVRLHNEYYDTRDHDLLRHGVTLRRRTGDADTGWHLKVPTGAARTEIRLPAESETVPAELRQLIRALSADTTVGCVATVDTERTIHRLLTSGSAELAEIADDTVTAVATGETAVVQRWREVEVELGDGDEEFLAQAAQWLTDAGAVPSRSGSKLGRALEADPHSGRAPEGSLAALVQAHLREQHRAMVHGDIGLRRGADVVHPTRTATRRFRSVLRIFDLFDAEQAAHLDAELKWYAAALGELRDLQVMRGELLPACAELPSAVRDRTCEHLIARLGFDERVQRERLLGLLDSDRYVALLRDVRAFVEQPPDGAGRVADEVQHYVRAARRTAGKRLTAAARPPQDDDRTHRARKAAKRARYVAELAVPVLGKKAERRAKYQHKIQNKLGRLQDGIVAAGYLEQITPRAAGRAGFGIGLLWREQQKRADKVRRGLAKLAER